MNNYEALTGQPNQRALTALSRQEEIRSDVLRLITTADSDRHGPISVNLSYWRGRFLDALEVDDSIIRKMIALLSREPQHFAELEFLSPEEISKLLDVVLSVRQHFVEQGLPLISLLFPGFH